MVDAVIITALFVSFFSILIVFPYWIKHAKANGFVGKDMHKKEKKEVAESGGVVVLFGISIGVLTYVAGNTFIFGNGKTLIFIFALLTSFILAGIVGMLDDFLGWKKGLSKRVRLLIILFSAIPLMAVNAGISNRSIPIIGTVNFGLLYPLLIIPLGVLGATTTFNFLAGYNGLEARQGFLLFLGLGLITHSTGFSWLSVICVISAVSLIAFYLFNKYPSKVFPGDSLTYPIGAMIAGIAILGNVEKIALLFFIPYIIEVCLKIRGKLRKESFAKLNDDGSLEIPYEKVYGLEHLSIKILKKIKPSKKVYEKDVVNLINAFQLLVIAIVLIIYL